MHGLSNAKTNGFKNICIVSNAFQTLISQSNADRVLLIQILMPYIIFLTFTYTVIMYMFRNINIVPIPTFEKLKSYVKSGTLSPLAAALNSKL